DAGALVVAGDGVTGPGSYPADGVASGPAVDAHADVVGQGGGAVRGGADPVALDPVVGGAFAADPDAIAGVAGDGVAGAVRRASPAHPPALVAVPGVAVPAPAPPPANHVAASPFVDAHADVVGQGGGAVRGGADAVALDPVAAGGAAGDPDAVLAVAGDGVAR